MTYVISDIHGRYDLYSELLEGIGFSANDTLYILGDAVDRNRGGIRILKEIMDRPNIHMLLGNHEHMMRRSIPEPEKICLNGHETNRELWYRNGGQVTQEEFEEEPEDVRERILRFIDQLPLNRELKVGETRFLFCHASPTCLFRTYGMFCDDETEFAVWNRIEPWMKVRFPADVLICGHTPTVYYGTRLPMEICKLRENVYDIDCGCAYGKENGGQLGCLRLEDGTIFYCS